MEAPRHKFSGGGTAGSPIIYDPVQSFPGTTDKKQAVLHDPRSTHLYPERFPPSKTARGAYSPFPPSKYTTANAGNQVWLYKFDSRWYRFNENTLRSHREWRIEVGMQQSIHPRYASRLLKPRNQPISYPAEVVKGRPKYFGAHGATSDAQIHFIWFPGNKSYRPDQRPMFDICWPTLALLLWDTLNRIQARRWLERVDLIALLTLCLTGYEDRIWIVRTTVSTVQDLWYEDSTNRESMVKRRFWVMPVNHRNGHWTLAIFDNVLGILYGFDSAEKGRDQELNASVPNWLSSHVLPWIVRSSDLIVTPLDVKIARVRTFQHVGGWESGLYAAEAARLFFRDHVFDLAAADPWVAQPLDLTKAAAYAHIVNTNRYPRNKVALAIISTFQAAICDALQLSCAPTFRLRDYDEDAVGWCQQYDQGYYRQTHGSRLAGFQEFAARVREEACQEALKRRTAFDAKFPPSTPSHQDPLGQLERRRIQPLSPPEAEYRSRRAASVGAVTSAREIADLTRSFERFRVAHPTVLPVRFPSADSTSPPSDPTRYMDEDPSWSPHNTSRQSPSTPATRTLVGSSPSQDLRLSRGQSPGGYFNDDDAFSSPRTSASTRASPATQPSLPPAPAPELPVVTTSRRVARSVTHTPPPTVLGEQPEPRTPLPHRQSFVPTSSRVTRSATRALRPVPEEQPEPQTPSPPRQRFPRTSRLWLPPYHEEGYKGW
jgi:hypothetical protein